MAAIGTNSCRRLTQANKFCAVAPNIYEPFLHVAVPGVASRFLENRCITALDSCTD